MTTKTEAHTPTLHPAEAAKQRLDAAMERSKAEWAEIYRQAGDKSVLQYINALRASHAELVQIMQALSEWYKAATDGKHIPTGPVAHALLFDDDRDLQEHIEAALAKAKELVP